MRLEEPDEVLVVHMAAEKAYLSKNFMKIHK